MTQRNIEVMDIMVSKMREGVKLSKAMKLVYKKRNVGIPYNESTLDVALVDLGMTNKVTNALMRAKFRTLGDVVDFCKDHKITDINSLGKASGAEVFETILDYCWAHMNNDERTAFLIDIVERNQGYIREEIA